MTNEEKEEMIKRIKYNPFIEFLNVEFNILDEGVVEARMPLADYQKQYAGVVHGGVVASLADTISGFAAHIIAPEDKNVLTADLKLSYLRAAWGKELFARGYVIKKGKTLIFSEAEIYCEEKLICKAAGTFCLVPRKV